MQTLENYLGQGKVIPQLRDITDKEWRTIINKILDEQRKAEEDRVNKYTSIKKH
jgi:hypothetical protein